MLNFFGMATRIYKYVTSWFTPRLFSEMRGRFQDRVGITVVALALATQAVRMLYHKFTNTKRVHQRSDLTVPPRVLNSDLIEQGFKPVRFLSYNFFARPPLVKNNADDVKNERTQAFIDLVLEEFDIICMQELFSFLNLRQRKVIKAAKERGFNYHVTSVNRYSKFKIFDAGLLILSRYPIIETDHHVYINGNQIDGWCSKQVVYALIKISEGALVHVFTTHTQASYFDTDPENNILNDTARIGQIRELSDFVRRKTRDSQYPILVAGDFNVDSQTHIGEDVPSMASGRSSNGDSLSDEYKEMMLLLRNASRLPCTDLLLEASDDNKHPITFGDVTYEEVEEEEETGEMTPLSAMSSSSDLEGQSRKLKTVPSETVLTHAADLCSRLTLDYIFFYNKEGNDDNNGNGNSKRIVIPKKETRVEPFFVEKGEHLFTQLSDHYGVSTVLYAEI